MELMERRRILLNTPHINIVTGLQFVTDMVAPIESLVISFSPIQDLHGYDSPWPAGAGKNLLNPSLLKNQAAWNTIKIYANEGTVLTASTSTPAGKGLIAYFRQPGGEQGTSNGVVTNAQHKDVTQTVGSAGYVELVQRRSDGTDLFQNYNWQIEVGSTATNYEPYENVCPIAGWTGVNVRRCGKNLFGGSILKAELLEIGGTDYGDNIGVSAGVLNNKILFDTIFRENTQYTLILDVRKPSGNTNANVRIYYTDGNYSNIFLSGDVTERQTVVVNSTSDKTIEKIGGINSSAGTYFYFDTCGLFEGVLTAEDFESYEGESYVVDWTDEAGTVYGGTLNVITGELVVDRVGFDGGDINWVKVDGYDYGNFYSPNLNPLPEYSATVPTVLSSIYRSAATSSGTSGDAYAWIRSVNIGMRRIYIKDTSKANMTAEEFKTSLIGVDFVYVLDEPIIYQLTPQQIRTVKGANNLFTNSNGEVTVNYWTHLD